jgi:hypothetical protein
LLWAGRDTGGKGTRVVLVRHPPDKCTSFHPSQACQLLRAAGNGDKEGGGLVRGCSSFFTRDEDDPWPFFFLPMTRRWSVVAVSVVEASVARNREMGAREIWAMTGCFWCPFKDECGLEAVCP